MERNMTIREKICQTVIINHPQKLMEEYGGYKKFFEKYPVGGIYLGGSIVGGKMAGVEETFELCREWNSELKIAPIYCADFESGANNIHQMAVGACASEDIAYRVGKENARICSNAGRHWMFNPVADLAMSAFAPISIRSLGDDADAVSQLLVKMFDGIKSQKVLGCAKHFPGMGRETTDTHLTRVSVDLSREEWDNTYRKIYKRLIDNGLMSVMTAHMSLPCYQTERNEYGEAPIATVSKELITDLLKNDLGFKGVVVTDGLIMGGAGGSTVDVAIDAFAAGHDMVLWPPMEYVDVLEQKILAGEIPEERLDDAVERILKVKAWLEVDKNREADENEYITPEEIAEHSITLLNNRKNVIPQNPDKVKKALLVYSAKDETSKSKMTHLETVLHERGIETVVRKNLWIPELRELEKETDFTIFACFEGSSATPGPICINGEDSINIWASQAADMSRTAVVSFGSPFLYSQYYRHYPTYINAYSNSQYIQEAVVRAIFGEIECVGKSPVKL